jgi:hypothetical protein
MAWVRIAIIQARLAEEDRASDELVDAMSARLAGEDREIPVVVEREWQELSASLVCVSAAAHAIDGFYGALKCTPGLPQLPAMGKAPRHSQIYETVKRYFRLGSESQRIREDLKWIFGLRDRAVHHADTYRDMVVIRNTDETTVVGAIEVYEYSAPIARRAADIAADLITFCLLNPTPALTEWTKQRSMGIDALIKLREG